MRLPVTRLLVFCLLFSDAPLPSVHRQKPFIVVASLFAFNTVAALVVSRQDPPPHSPDLKQRSRTVNNREGMSNVSKCR